MTDNKQTKWTVHLEEDPETGDLILPFPPDMLAQVGWDCGDVIVWNRDDHGNFILSKKEDNGISNTVGQNTN